MDAARDGTRNLFKSKKTERMIMAAQRFIIEEECSKVSHKVWVYFIPTTAMMWNFYISYLTTTSYSLLHQEFCEKNTGKEKLDFKSSSQETDLEFHVTAL